MSAPAGWNPDPLKWHQYRYWDGTTWTDNVADQGVASIDPLRRGPKPEQPSTIPAPASAKTPPSVAATPKPAARGPRVVTASREQLAEIGYRAFGGDSPFTPGFTLSDYDHFCVTATSSGRSGSRPT